MTVKFIRCHGSKNIQTHHKLPVLPVARSKIAVLSVLGLLAYLAVHGVGFVAPLNPSPRVTTGSSASLAGAVEPNFAEVQGSNLAGQNFSLVFNFWLEVDGYLGNWEKLTGLVSEVQMPFETD